MTEAIPFGIYRAPLDCIRADVYSSLEQAAEVVSKEEVSSNDTQLAISRQVCYIQLIRRVSEQLYAIYLAGSVADLLQFHDGDYEAEDHIIVSTISRKDLHLRCQLVTAPEAEKPLYAAPDVVLQDKFRSDGTPLQFCASSVWMCYFTILRAFEDGAVQVRVAALPHRLKGGRGNYITTLTPHEVALALQLEREDLKMATGDLLEKVELHAERILQRSIERVHPRVEDKHSKETEGKHEPKPAYPPEVLKMLHPVQVEELPCAHLYDEEDLLPEAQQPVLEKIRPIFVPETLAKEAVARLKATLGKATISSRRLEQQAWLQAVLLALGTYKEQTTRKATQKGIEKIDRRIRSVLVNWLNDAVLLVEAIPVVFKKGYQKKGELPLIEGYVVRIELPKVA